MDKQTVYKNSVGCYENQRDRLLNNGYRIEEDTEDRTVFVGQSIAERIMQDAKELEVLNKIKLNYEHT
jgi:hypothetical protein